MQRVEQLNPQLNAVVALDTDRARARAEAADLADMSEPMLQMRGIALSHRGWLRQNERRLKTRGIRERLSEVIHGCIMEVLGLPAMRPGNGAVLVP